MSAETELHDAICSAVIILNNGEEIAPEVSAILRTALAKYNPAPPVVERGLQQAQCPNCLNDGCHCATCNPFPGGLQQAQVVGDEMVAKAYRVCEDFIEEHGDGYINDLDDGQWNEMLRAALTAALGKGEG